MKEIHLGQILGEHRRKQKVTQEELACFLGVSKAAVSKWETETAYPDILMLPKLASFFDITIDELLGYDPQLTPEEICRIHNSLAKEFADQPFSQVLEHCREYIRKYSSCWPFLFQAGSLFINHIALCSSPEETQALTKEALELFRKVKTQAQDPNLCNNALQMEAYCLLLLNRPEEVLDLLSEMPSVTGPFEPLLSSAWQMTGNMKEAKRVLQIGIYKDMLSIINQLLPYIRLCTDDAEALLESCRRLKGFCSLFHLETLHPGVFLSCLLTMAQELLIIGEKDQCLELLDEYTSLAAGEIYPLKLHGDDYFSFIDSWFEKTSSLGDYPPRDEAVIRRSITQALTENPALKSLEMEPRFLEMVEKLKEKEQEVHRYGNNSSK